VPALQARRALGLGRAAVVEHRVRGVDVGGAQQRDDVQRGIRALRLRRHARDRGVDRRRQRALEPVRPPVDGGAGRRPVAAAGDGGPRPAGVEPEPGRRIGDDEAHVHARPRARRGMADDGVALHQLRAGRVPGHHDRPQAREPPPVAEAGDDGVEGLEGAQRRGRERRRAGLPVAHAPAQRVGRQPVRLDVRGDQELRHDQHRRPCARARAPHRGLAGAEVVAGVAVDDDDGALDVRLRHRPVTRDVHRQHAAAGRGGDHEAAVDDRPHGPRGGAVGVLRGRLGGHRRQRGGDERGQDEAGGNRGDGHARLQAGGEPGQRAGRRAR
jgi:hypothetical protein